MPDMERLIRSLANHCAGTPERKAYLAGLHAGEDRARKQVAIAFALVALVFVFAAPYLLH